MTEPVMVSAKKQYQPKSTKAIADYDDWFAKQKWTLEEVAALVLGLNPDVVFDSATTVAYENDCTDHPVTYDLWQYSEKGAGDWRELLEKSEGDFRDYYCANELDEIVNKLPDGTDAWTPMTVKPMDIIQWCIDENIPLHYRLTEHLLEKGYDFRFSKNSRILSEIQIYAKKDIWSMPCAARLILGLSPELPKILLLKHKNLYRHLDPNYSMTQRDEVYYVMERALESWKTKSLDFFEFHGDDPEVQYYDDEECTVSVESRKFVEWAIKKGFKIPEQLLECMGIIVNQQQHTKNTDNKPVSVQQTENTKPPFWLEFSNLSGEVMLNGLFMLACPTPNGQNYRIIKYLLENPNRFVTTDELITKALDGKDLDKRLTDFAAQINMNKDLGKLFFDTSKDSIRLINPVTLQRMTEQNIRRVRIKPA